MPKYSALLIIIVLVMFAPAAHASYPQGCTDPAYQDYINDRFFQSQKRNRRLLDDTLRDYKVSVSVGHNLYQVIASLSRHLKYSAQFDSPEMVHLKIDRVFEHADELSVEQRIAGDVFDRFSTETHAVGIARAWLAYRQGETALAFSELLSSIDITGSALLSTYGPDFDFVRQIYRDGHTDTVIAYLEKTKLFWFGEKPDELRNTWLKMIEAGCQIHFDSTDTLKADQLGIIDVRKALGVED